MAKSLTQIHQQTIDILDRLGRRNHTSPDTFDRVIAIHNHYYDNVADAYKAHGADFFGLPQWTQPVPTSVYARQRPPMTDKDRERIRLAKEMHWSDWHIVGRFEDEADTEEARAILHDIRRNYAVREKYSADFNL